MSLKWLGPWLSLAGLDELRCASCLRPFSPATLEPGLATALPVCPECRLRLAPYMGARCPHCGLPFPSFSTAGNAAAAPCGDCQSERPPWRAFAYHGLYKGALRELILRFKFGGELALTRPLAAWLEDAARCLPVPDAMLALPQHPAHLRRRGFNQAHELARGLHHVTAIPLRADILIRKRDSAPQASLNARERARNVRDVFGAGAHVQGMRLWLIDDVMTTGSTLKEATRTLLEAGAAEVCALTVARTPRSR